MAEGRRSKHLKVFHELDDASVARSAQRFLRQKEQGAPSKATRTADGTVGGETFRFCDLPKDIRLEIYEVAFEPPPGGRKIVIFIQKQVYNATFIYSNGSPCYAAHGLLMTNEQIHEEAIDVFHRHSKFQVKCCGFDFSSVVDPFGGARLYQLSARHDLGAIRDCRFFNSVQHLSLEIHIQASDFIRELITRLQPLTGALAGGQKLACLNIKFLHQSDPILEISGSVKDHYFRDVPVARLGSPRSRLQ